VLVVVFRKSLLTEFVKFCLFRRSLRTASRYMCT